MDPSRFDRLTRVVGGAPSRRALLGLLAGAVSGLTAAGGEAQQKRRRDAGRSLVAARRCQKATSCPRPPACKKRVCRRQRCAVVAKPNGARCTNANPCIVDESCRAGKCQGTLRPDCVRCDADPTACDALPVGQCREIVCSPQGFCEERDKAGGPCNHPNPCVANATCAGGQCVGDPDADCVRCDNAPNACDDLPPANQCREVVCTAQGVCEERDKDGGACDHENPCVASATCANGQCSGELDAGCVRCDENPNACAAVTELRACERSICDGQRGVCITEPRGSGFMCRAASGPCELNATCDGVNPDCPANPFRDANFQCRPPVNSCDQAEFCTGSSAACPANQSLPDNTLCGPTGPCSEFRCHVGQCIARPLSDNTTCNGNRKCCRGICCADSRQICQGSCCLPSSQPCNLSSQCCSNSCDVFTQTCD